MKLSIIIPTTFDPTLTYECIQSIQNTVTDVEYDFLVIDNLSEPKFEMEGIPVKRYEERLGFAKAMNEGIKNTTSDYVLLLNNDTVIKQPNFLSSMIETLNSVDNIGIVSPTCDFIASPLLKFPNLESIPNDVIENAGHISAVCWLIKRSTFDKIGLFDENYKIGSFEDGDYCQRVLTEGMKIMLDRRIWIKHYGSRTVSQTPGYYESFQENSNYYHTKWKV